MKRVKTKSISLVISLLMILGVMAGGTLAFLRANTEDIANTFTPSTVDTTVNEGYTITNDKTDTATTAWIRAYFTVTWQKDGVVYGKAPNYTAAIGEKWIAGADGFYYWPTPVAPGESTGALFATAPTTTEQAPAKGYEFTVEVIGSGIQSVPEEVVENVWGVTVEDGVIIAGGGNQ